MEKRTNIQIEHKTLKRIGKLKNTKGETNDDVLNRIMDENRKDKYKADMSIGEFLDRLSILLHKTQKIGPSAYPEFIKYVGKFLLEINLSDFDKAIEGFRNLYEINGKIWFLESELRKGYEKELGLQEIGKRALKIRDLNTQRIKEQNRLIESFGGFKNVNPEYWEYLKYKSRKTT